MRHFISRALLALAAGAALLAAATLADDASAQTVTIQSYRGVQVNETGAGTVGSAKFTLSAVLTPLYFPSGSSNGQASQVYVAHRTISASSTDTLVLTSGLTDPLGNALVFTGVKGVWILPDATNAANIVVGNAASHPFQGWFGGATSTESIPSGGSLLHDNPQTPWTVTTNSADQLAITNSSGSVTAGYQIVIWN